MNESIVRFFCGHLVNRIQFVYMFFLFLSLHCGNFGNLLLLSAWISFEA